MGGIALLLGPVTWVGAAVAVFWRRHRMRHERATFGLAIDRRYTNWWAGLIGGVIVGVVVSALAIAGGLLLPPLVLIGLTAITLVMLLASGLGYSVWPLSLAGVFAMAIGIAEPDWLPANLPVTTWGWRFAALLAALWVANGFLLRFLNPSIDEPTLLPWRRSTEMAVYTRRQFYWVPLVLPLSGDNFVALPWWPTLTVGTTHFTLIGLPLMLGLVLTTQKILPTAVADVWAKDNWLAGGLAAIVAAVMWWEPETALAGTILLAVIGVGLAIFQHRATRLGHERIAQSPDGVRLIAILPDTPAAKMGLSAGDMVLACNNEPVSTAVELYAAVQRHPAYVRLKVRRLDGELRLAETAIFAGAPHELGMITFAEDQQA